MAIHGFQKNMVFIGKPHSTFTIIDSIIGSLALIITHWLEANQIPIVLYAHVITIG